MPIAGVHEADLAGAEVVQGHKDIRMQLGDQVEDLRLDVVHVGPLRQLDPVVLHGSLLELGKGFRDLGAVVGLAVVLADLDAVAPDVDAVPDPGETLLEAADLADEQGEALGVGVVREVLAKRSEPA